MKSLPIIQHYEPRVAGDEQERAKRLAEILRSEHSELEVPEALRPLVVETLTDAPALHLDDYSAIPLLDRDYDVRFLQERARLRAGDGDFVASCFVPMTSYKRYCRERLGLGAPTWLNPRSADSDQRVAAACWTDRAVRNKLVHALRANELLYVHPHMGIFDVWQLAALLRRSSRRDVRVIAPHPGLTKWVNHKLTFAETVDRLFGPSFVPRTEEAANFAMLSTRVRDMAGQFRDVVVKLPDSAGGGGTVILEAVRFRGRSLATTSRILKARLRDLDWHGQSRLLVGGWVEHVLCSPSTQLWIPPMGHGGPIVEAVLEQQLRGREQKFIGSRPARLPPSVIDEVVARSWLLGSVFQHLGYVGRCSFDLLLSGPDLDRSRLHFIECNGRWGGASAPMLLVNRLFNDWLFHPYATRETVAPGLEHFTFTEVLRHFADDLYDVRTGRGWLVFCNPGRIQSHSGINVLALDETWEGAERRAGEVISQRICDMVAEGHASA